MFVKNILFKKGIHLNLKKISLSYKANYSDIKKIEEYENHLTTR